MGENRCVICWEVIPEGRWVCPVCFASIMNEKQQESTKREEVRKLINWRVRFANKNFWLQAIPALLLLIQVVLNVFGVTFDFGDIGNKLLAVVNAVFAFLAILGVVNDPTTDGLNDSKRAMTYELPYKDWADEEDY